MSKFRVQHFTSTVTIAASGTNASLAVNLPNGIIRSLTVNAPALTGASYTTAILGPVSETLYSKASMSPNGVTTLVADGTNLPSGGVAVDGSSTIKITSAGTEASQRVFTVDVLIDRGA